MKKTTLQDSSNPSLILIIYLTAAIFVMIASPILTLRWSQNPFIGGFLTPTLKFTTAAKIITDETCQMQKLGLEFNEQLIAIDGQVVQSSLEVSNKLSNFQESERVILTISHPSGEISQVEIPLIRFSGTARLIYIYFPLMTAIICFISGLWIYSDNRKHQINLAYTVFATSMAIMVSSYFDFFTVHQLVPMFLISIGIAAASLVQLALLLPWHRQKPEKKPWLNYIAYPLNFFFVGIAIIQVTHPSIDSRTFTFLWILLASLCLSMLFFVFALLMMNFRTVSSLIQKRSQTLLITSLCSFLPFIITFLLNIVNTSKLTFPPLTLIPLCVFPITYALTTRRYLLHQTKRSFTLTLVYFLITLIFGVVYFVLINLLNIVLISPIAPDNPLLMGVMIFLVIFTIQPLQRKITQIFTSAAPLAERSKDLALKYASSLTSINDTDLAIALLRDAIIEIMHPEHVHIYLYDPEIPGYFGNFDSEKDDQENWIIPRDSIIATTLEKLRDILYFKQNTKPTAEKEADHRLWDKHGSVIFAPLPATYGIHGWAAIGAKSDGTPYTAEEIDLIGNLTHQFAVVYERADAMVSIRSSLNEMEILNQIAVAINNNNDLDRLLTSIFKQIRPLFHIDRFSLVMESAVKGSYQRLFLIEDGEKTVSTHQPEELEENFIEKDSITQGRTQIINQAVTTLVVPLTMEDGVMGAISLGHSNDNKIFNRANLNMVNSIASLVSGAIIKANLLQASQQQAEQLAMLNKVSHQLTSTLILEPLLKNILEGALEILNSSSAILMTIDEKRKELVFKVGTGPIGAPLIGKRLPADAGIAGESYTTKTAVIRNDIDQDILWFKDTHPEVISRIQSILAVPLITRGEVVGILEIINKNNNLPFNENDMRILKGFASQAAIALHNATLYTETDRALEKRIDELYTMQKIDRELNSTRDMTLALEITLRAALSHTRAEAGSIGLIDVDSDALEEVCQILPDVEDPIYKESIELADFPWFCEELKEENKIINSLNVSEVLDIPADYQSHYLKQSELEETHHILLLLHLNSASDLNQEDHEFLNRLGDHAFLALKNTFLYQELQDAIQEKNEFISYISHELKNPLTVIKGYADILRKGMAGDINDEQVDFLTTITHNVRQMSTFITDLSDQSRIETRSLRLNFEESSVQEVIDEVLHTYENQINEKSLDIQLQVDKDIPNVWCDRLRLIQIQSNLVSNAIKYTAEGGKIQIGAKHAINQWDEKGAAEVVHFWVGDNGFGISEEDQKHIFEKFFRGTRQQITKIPGSGLGLRISKTLTEMMGGVMWFESAEGKGSTFHFTIPI